MKKQLLFVALLALIAGPTYANTCTPRQAGAVDQTVVVELLDTTTGVPTAGLAFNSSGIDLEYVRTAAAAVDITEATQTAAGAHSDGGFVSLGHGRYRLDLPDAAVAAGVPDVTIQGIITGYILAPCVVALSPPVNVISISGTTQTARDIGASVLISSGTGTGQLSVTSGVIAANITQAGGSAISQTGGLLNANATQLSGDATAADNAESFFDGTGYAGTNNVIPTVTTVTNGVTIAESTTNCREVLGCDTQGTLSGTHSTTTADLGTNAPENDIACMTLIVPSRNFTRVVSSYNTGTGVATWVDATAVTLTNADQYYLYATAPGSGGSLTAAQVWAHGDRQLTAFDEDTTTIDINATTLGTVTTATTATNLTNLPTIPANWLTAAGTAADFTTEVTASVATQASVNTVDDFLDTEMAALTTNLATANTNINTIDDFLDTEMAALTTNLATANTNILVVDDYVDTEITALISALNVVDDFLDTEIAAIKAKTDPMTFTLTNFLQIDAQYMNGVEILGAGTEASPWNGE
jgi:hypothetical protein